MRSGNRTKDLLKKKKKELAKLISFCHAPAKPLKISKSTKTSHIRSPEFKMNVHIAIISGP